MGQRYRFYVETKIFGSVVRELEDGETPEEVAEELAGETVSYDDMERSGYVVNVESECDEWDQRF